MLFAGDLLLSRGVERRLTRNPRFLGEVLGPTFSRAEWVLGNLEGAVGSQDDCQAAAGKAPCFPIRAELIPLLRDAGFKALSLENNHSFDLGRSAREATRRLLVQSGMMALTYENSPEFIQLGEITVSLIGLSMVPWREGHDADLLSVGLRQKLRIARNLSNLVVVYVHWGSEFLDWPEKKQRQTAEWLIRHGAEIIVGHHPHVIQKPECLHGRPVFYSIGNLLFDQKYPSTKQGLLAECVIGSEIARCSALQTRIPAESVFPGIGEEDTDAREALSGCEIKLAPLLNINGLTLRPESISSSERSSGLMLEALREGSLLWKTRHAEIFSIETMHPGGAHAGEFLFTLERHYSTLDGEEGLRPCVYEVRPEGISPRWRGTALAWPLVDAVLLPGHNGILCALHRGDSFIVLQPQTHHTRVAAYQWNGFGFSGIHDLEVIASCRDLFQ
jgi:poly-gamma-glutamate synthesis protein (capsule biosynthesis protein)